MSESELTSHSIAGMIPQPPHYLRGMAGVAVVVALLVGSALAIIKYLL